MVGKFKVKYLVGSSKEYNGKTYCDVTVMQSDDVKKLSCDNSCFHLFRGHEMEDVLIDVELREFSSDKGVQRSYRVVGVEVQNNGK